MYSIFVPKRRIVFPAFQLLFAKVREDRMRYPLSKHGASQYQCLASFVAKSVCGAVRRSYLESQNPPAHEACIDALAFDLRGCDIDGFK